MVPVGRIHTCTFGQMHACWDAVWQLHFRRGGGRFAHEFHGMCSFTVVRQCSCELMHYCVCTRAVWYSRKRRYMEHKCAWESKLVCLHSTGDSLELGHPQHQYYVSSCTENASHNAANGRIIDDTALKLWVLRSYDCTSCTPLHSQLYVLGEEKESGLLDRVPSTKTTP